MFTFNRLPDYFMLITQPFHIISHQDCTLKQNELDAIRTQTEREALEKHKLEDSVMEKMMQRLTMDKATQYTQKSVKKVVKRSKELVRRAHINLSS